MESIIFSANISDLSSMMMVDLHIQVCDLLDEPGYFKFAYSDTEIEYNGELYKYHSSGLAREVFISKCGKWVIKIPVSDSGVCVMHNLMEALAYYEASAPDKELLARTELLENGWIRQEFVDVFESNIGLVDFRELGKAKDGRIVVFDFDPLLEGYQKPYGGFYYSHIRRVLSEHYQ